VTEREHWVNLDIKKPLRTRDQSCQFYNDLGIPLKPRYFERLCNEGQGPVGVRFGIRWLYTEEALLAWVKSRIKINEAAA
jgi:hypothetical protein